MALPAPLSFGPSCPTSGDAPKGTHTAWEEKAGAMGVFLLTLNRKMGPPDAGGWRWTGSSGMWSASPSGQESRTQESSGPARARCAMQTARQ